MCECNPFTGLSGRYSCANNVYELRDNLFKKKDMVCGPMREWELMKTEVPNKLGKINDVEKFDSGFFGTYLTISYKSIISCINLNFNFIIDIMIKVQSNFIVSNVYFNRIL